MSQLALHGNQPSVVGATERVFPVIWIFFKKVLPAYLTKGAFQEQSLYYLQLKDGRMKEFFN